jgi:glucokinase
MDAGSIDMLTLALPGLVTDNTARLTNLSWTLSKQKLTEKFGISKVNFINDFQASAYGTSLLQENDLVVLNPGAADSPVLGRNNVSVAVGAGTGLGVSWLLTGRHGVQAYASEGGHIQFAPANEEQIQLLRFMRKRFVHVSCERLLSGDGLVALYEFCAGKEDSNYTAERVNRESADNENAAKALSLFVQIYGAYIGNIAVLFKPSAGIYITGGIAAKIVSKMQSGEFIDAYLHKGRMRDLVENIAVYLVTNERVGALGAMSETLKFYESQDE